MMRFLLAAAFAALFLLASCGNGPEEAPPSPVDSREAEVLNSTATQVDSVTAATHARLMQLAQEQNLSERPIGEVIHTFAEELLGKPYVEHMLDQTEEEVLGISLAGFDCVLFNEAVLALAQAVRARDYSIDAFARNIESLRYRDGRLVDYCSRLHYFSDWLRDNHRRGNVRIITADLRAAQPFPKRIDFMTEHRDAYRGLEDDDQFACIADAQRDLSREEFTYVPQDRIAEVYDQLESGDVLALTTSVRGLDIAHTGFVYRHQGGVGLIHASTTGAVRVDRDLQRYVQSIRIQNGIMVARAVDPGEGR